MSRLVKTCLAVLLLPVCVGSSLALIGFITASGEAEKVWVPVIAGVSCWCVVYLSLPKPLWLYVVGHELTHVLCVWLFGGQVHKFRASASGGFVVATKSNFWILLAPYFFPLYAFLVAGVFLVIELFWNLGAYAAFFHLLIGATYAFHLTLTWDALSRQQSDVSAHGYLFSGVVIWLGNLAVLVIGLPLLTGPNQTLAVLQRCGIETEKVISQMLKWLP